MAKNKPEKKKMKKSTKVILIVLSVILALILAAMITVVIWGKVLLSKIPRLSPNVETLTQEEAEDLRNETDPVDPDFTGPTYDSNEIEMPDDSADKIANSSHIINIMLVGQDRRPGQGRQRSDAMILCTINTKTTAAAITISRRTPKTVPQPFFSAGAAFSAQFSVFFTSSLITPPLTITTCYLRNPLRTGFQYCRC